MFVVERKSERENHIVAITATNSVQWGINPFQVAFEFFKPALQIFTEPNIFTRLFQDSC